MSPLSLLILAAAVAVLQAVCWGLARALGQRLEKRLVAMAVLLPLVLLAPWIFGRDLAVPTGVMDGVLPHTEPALPDHRTHLILSDTLYQFLPWELEVRHALRSGRLPLWSDTLDGGGSPWLNPQAAVLSPLAMLVRPLPIQHFLAAMLVLKLMLAGEGTWLLARRLGRSRVAALVAASGFAFGGGVMAWGLFPHSATVAWVPWLVLGCIETCRRPRPAAVAATAVITAALLLSGHPETALDGGLLAALAGLWLLRRRPQQRSSTAAAGGGRRRGGAAGGRLGWFRGLAAAGLAAALGFGLAAPQMLPFAAAVAESQRARDMAAAALPPHDVRWLEPRTWFIHETAAFLLAPLNPQAFGEPYGARFSGPFDWADSLSPYAGLAVLAGALVALAVTLTGRRGRAARPFLAFAAAALLVVAGFVPLATAIHAVPPLRVPAWPRLLPVMALAMSVAAAFGWDELLRNPRRRQRERRQGAALAALVLAAAVSLAVAPAPAVIALWAALLGSALVAAIGRPPRQRVWAAALLLLAVAADLAPWSYRTLPHGQPSLFFPQNPLTNRLTQEVRAAGGPWRCTALHLLVYPSLLPAYGIGDIRPNNVMAPASYLRVLRDSFAFEPTTSLYYAPFYFPDHPMLSFLGVRVVVANPYLQLPRTLQPMAAPRVRPFLLFRNPRALPRWFLPGAADVIERPQLDDWIRHMADAGRVALFRDEAADWRPALGNGVQAVELQSEVPGHVRLRLPPPSPSPPPSPAMRGDRLLATSLPIPGGWRAIGEGGRLATLTVDGAFLGVRIPPPVTAIDLDFSPPGFRSGVAAGVASLLGVMALAIAAVGQRRRQRHRPWRRPRGSGAGTAARPTDAVIASRA